MLMLLTDCKRLGAWQAVHDNVLLALVVQVMHPDEHATHVGTPFTVARDVWDGQEVVSMHPKLYTAYPLLHTVHPLELHVLQLVGHAMHVLIEFTTAK